MGSESNSASLSLNCIYSMFKLCKTWSMILSLSVSFIFICLVVGCVSHVSHGVKRSDLSLTSLLDIIKLAEALAAQSKRDRFVRGPDVFTITITTFAVVPTLIIPVSLFLSQPHKASALQCHTHKTRLRQFICSPGWSLFADCKMSLTQSNEAECDSALVSSVFRPFLRTLDHTVK